MNYPRWQDLAPADREQSEPLSFFVQDRPALVPVPVKPVRGETDQAKRAVKKISGRRVA